MKNSQNILNEAKGTKGQDKLFEPKTLFISDCLKEEESEMMQEMAKRETEKEISPMALFES